MASAMGNARSLMRSAAVPNGAVGVFAGSRDPADGAPNFLNHRNVRASSGQPDGTGPVQ
ncbi:hypothetical protein PMO31116_02098 [Pandoraea morbifera]|uniref:Uncharacterized protein n=1 Tax=Pandoraea morbifera TaxID=2508300 RepID=A0A5E4ULC6_9BURK|nr:hypothetical protein PMO31116_02098 [Pandoraea morbifera]